MNVDSLATFDDLDDSGRQFAQTILDFFEEENWNYELREDSFSIMLSFEFEGENGSWNCISDIRPMPEEFYFYSICPISIPKEKYLCITEFITRVNFGIYFGNFEFDFENGLIRYKTSLDVKGGGISKTLVKRLVYSNVYAMDTYISGIKMLVTQDLLPVEVIKMLEEVEDEC